MYNPLRHMFGNYPPQHSLADDFSWLVLLACNVTGLGPACHSSLELGGSRGPGSLCAPLSLTMGLPGHSSCHLSNHFFTSARPATALHTG